MNETTSNLLNVSELARFLNVPKSWVYGQTRKRGPDSMPVVRLGKYVRFDPHQILNWLRTVEERRKDS